MARKVQVPPPPNNVKDRDHYSWANWYVSMYERLGSGPLLIQGYSVSSLPAASEWGSISSPDPFTSIIFVYDETNGPIIAYSDGTAWKRVTDGATVS